MINIDWKNPNFDHKKTKTNVVEQSNINTDDNIILLDTILEQKEESKLEYINAPRVSNITGVPKNIEFEVVDLGKLIVKYEQFFKDNKLGKISSINNVSIDEDNNQSMGLAV